MRAAALRTYRELLQAAWVREVPVGPVDETLARVGRILRDADIPFAVAGGFAVIEHGYERFTNDDERALAHAARARSRLPVISVVHLILMKLGERTEQGRRRCRGAA